MRIQKEDLGIREVTSQSWGTEEVGACTEGQKMACAPGSLGPESVETRCLFVIPTSVTLLWIRCGSGLAADQLGWLEGELDANP